MGYPAARPRRTTLTPCPRPTGRCRRALLRGPQVDDRQARTYSSSATAQSRPRGRDANLRLTTGGTAKARRCFGHVGGGQDGDLPGPAQRSSGFSAAGAWEVSLNLVEDHDSDANSRTRQAGRFISRAPIRGNTRLQWVVIALTAVGGMVGACSDNSGGTTAAPQPTGTTALDEGGASTRDDDGPIVEGTVGLADQHTFSLVRDAYDDSESPPVTGEVPEGGGPSTSHCSRLNLSRPGTPALLTKRAALRSSSCPACGTSTTAPSTSTACPS